MTMKTLIELKSSIPQIEGYLHYTFQDKNLLVMAFTHRSFVNEHPDLISQDNQRLEFLGDSILGLIAAEFLFRLFPEKPEGELSPLKACLVEASSCITYLQKLHLKEFLLLGKGEQGSTGRGKESLLADLFESVVGALYLDGGYAVARDTILSKVGDAMEEMVYKPSSNYKAELQTYLQKKGFAPPLYLVVKEWGPAHQKMFHVVVSINEKILGEGQGPSKKIAEIHAAKNGYEKLFEEEKS